MLQHEDLTSPEFETVEQECLVQGVVTEVTNENVHYLITHVLHGKERVLDDDFYPQYETASVFSGWYSELPNSYRALLEETQKEDSERLPTRVDTVTRQEGLELSPGDTIHIHDTLLWGHWKGGSKQGHTRIDICRLPTENIGLEAMLSQLRTERKAKVQQAIIDMRANEQAAMDECVRIQPGVPIHPIADPGEHAPDAKRYQRVTKRFVFGDGVVEDHFVDVQANEVMQMDLETKGVRRFGQDESQYIVHPSMPFGEGTNDDPLYELEIHIHSTTKLNPAVGEVRPVVIIDGVTYQSFVDPECSSHYYQEPGHDVYFKGFRPSDVEFDMSELSKAQKTVLLIRHTREHKIAMETVYRYIAEDKDIRNMEDMDEDAQAEIEKQIALCEDEQDIIDSIQGNNRTYTMSSGAPIWIPRSMLDAVELTFHSIEE